MKTYRLHTRSKQEQGVITIKKLNILFLLVFLILSSSSSAQTIDSILTALKQVDSQYDFYSIRSKFSNLEVTHLLIPQSEVHNLKLKKTLKMEVGTVEKTPGTNNPCSYLKVIDKGNKYLMKARYIFLSKNSGTDQELSDQTDMIINKIRAGENFENLARKFSQDSNSKKGGNLGWFSENLMVQEFENSVKNHKSGDIFKIKIPIYGWYVIKITDKHGPKDFIEIVKIESEKCN